MGIKIPHTKNLLVCPDGSIRDIWGNVLANSKEDVKELQNALGFEIPITTLTEIKRKITEQKFYEVPIADYIPLVVGEGAFSTNLLAYTAFSTGSDFEAGVINTGANNSRLPEADVAIEPLNIKIVNWAKAIGYSLFDIQQAAKSGSWSLIEQKEKARYQNWSLGIQKIAFCGSAIDPDVVGLLGLTTVTSNTTLITKTISSMTEAEFQTLVARLLAAYQANCSYTTMPDTFIIPTADFLGLGVAASAATYAGIGKTKLGYLLDTFKEMTGNPNFKILPLVYAQSTQNSAGKNRYVLYKNDVDTLEMDIPVDYTTTIQDTVNGFHWQSAAYGQYTGVFSRRYKEILYFDYQ